MRSAAAGESATFAPCNATAYKLLEGQIVAVEFDRCSSWRSCRLALRGRSCGQSAEFTRDIFPATSFGLPSFPQMT